MKEFAYNIKFMQNLEYENKNRIVINNETSVTDLGIPWLEHKKLCNLAFFASAQFEYLSSPITEYLIPTTDRKKLFT